MSNRKSLRIGRLLEALMRGDLFCCHLSWETVVIRKIEVDFNMYLGINDENFKEKFCFNN